MSMKILLVAVNAKYIHSNPALYSLKAYARQLEGRQIDIAEYTINHRLEEILADLYRHSPDMLAISCYIWNWELVSMLLSSVTLYIFSSAHFFCHLLSILAKS